MLIQLLAELACRVEKVKFKFPNQTLVCLLERVEEMWIPSHGLFDRQTIHVQNCTTERESLASPDHVQFKSGRQEAEHTGRFRGLYRQVFLHYRCLRLKARGKNRRRGRPTELEARQEQARGAPSPAARLHPGVPEGRSRGRMSPRRAVPTPRAAAAVCCTGSVARWAGGRSWGPGAEGSGRTGRRCPGS